MNLYQKMAAIRVTLQNGGMKKSGRNKHANYDYFDLEDIAPVVNQAEADVGLCSYVSFGTELATLTIVDTDKPEDRMMINSPMSTAKLPACHEVQNLGAVETYIRRYLYTAAYNIVEHDALDATVGADKPAQSAAGTGKDKLDKLYLVAASRGFGETSVRKGILKRYNKLPESMDEDEYQAVLSGYKALAEKAG